MIRRNLLKSVILLPVAGSIIRKAATEAADMEFLDKVTLAMGGIVDAYQVPALVLGSIDDRPTFNLMDEYHEHPFAANLAKAIDRRLIQGEGINGGVTLKILIDGIN